MEAKITGVTTTDPEKIQNFDVNDLEYQGGYNANICYTKKDWDDILTEPKESTEKRILGNKENNHHSVFGHGYISLYLTGIPKLLAMELNNEHEYNTSEKSARYTKMAPTEKELLLYDKWTMILEKEIRARYSEVPFLMERNRYHKLAMENARYMISVMTPTKMAYTTSFRQWNYIYDFARKAAKEETTNPLKLRLKPYMEEFADTLQKTGIITGDMKDYRNRGFSLIVDDNDYPEYFGRTYSVNYLATYAEVAQQQRHRSLYYNMEFLNEEKYFIPSIIEGNQELEKQWMEDIASVGDLIPQGRLVQVNESGNYEYFIMKLQERLCSCAQLETCMQNKEVLDKYVAALQASNDPRLNKVLDAIMPYTKGARCMSGYVCKEPCGFKEGITLTRKI